MSSQVIEKPDIEEEDRTLIVHEHAHIAKTEPDTEANSTHSHDHSHNHTHDHSHNHTHDHGHGHGLKKKKANVQRKPRPGQVCILEGDEEFISKLEEGNKAFGKLRTVVIICFLFMIVEICGGFMSHSLAILTDAAHMLSDVGGFAISMFSIKVGQMKPTERNSYGYHRAEVVGAMASVMIIWVMVIWLSWEATERIINIDEAKLDGKIMLITSFVSLACNIFNLVALGHFPLPCIDNSNQENFMDSVMSIYKPHGGHTCGHDHGPGGHDHDHDHGHGHGHSHSDSHSHSHADHDHGHSHSHSGHGHSHKEGEININIRAAFVHVVGDMLQSIGVIIAAILITFVPGTEIADPICTYLFSILVIMTTIPVSKDCMRILMEGQPTTVDADSLRNDIKGIDEVDEVNDMHVWCLAGGKNVMTCHVDLKEPHNDDLSAEDRNKQVHFKIQEFVDNYDICHFTAQML